tara:strand:+ start:769 stop:1170 length:402 start_codon:yes stop_codon:yes gene_type:complete
MITRLFVYGTLKSDQSNHYRLTGQRYIGIAHTTTDYRLFEIEGRFETLGTYPGLVKLPYPNVTDKGISIQGELWDVDDECLDKLNAYEDLDSGEYVIEEVSLIDKPDDIPVMSYLYRWDIRGMHDCGTSWTFQ